MVVPGSGDRPVEHLRFDCVGEGLPLGTLPGAMDYVAALGAEGVDDLSGLLVDEDVVVLGFEPVESHALKVNGLQCEPSLDEVTHELHGFVGPFAGELRTEPAFRRLGIMAGIRVVMVRIVVKFLRSWKGMVPTP